MKIVDLLAATIESIKLTFIVWEKIVTIDSVTKQDLYNTLPGMKGLILYVAKNLKASGAFHVVEIPAN